MYWCDTARIQLHPVEKMEMDKVCGNEFAVVKSIFEGTTSRPALG